MKVLFIEEAAISLDSLVEILYHKEYFGFIESSEIYISKIYDFIHENIQNFPRKKTPKQLFGYGRNYIFYKINPRTTWFIFFETDNINFLVTQVINNHCEEAKLL
jgi:hypothetical protein